MWEIRRDLEKVSAWMSGIGQDDKGSGNLIRPDSPFLSTDEFMDAVDAELRRACTTQARANSRKSPRADAFSRLQEQPGPERQGRKPGGTCDCGRLRRRASPLACGLMSKPACPSALRDFELDFLSFLERFEPAHLNRGEVREQIFAAVIRGYKAITLGTLNHLTVPVGIEPS